MGRSNGCNGLKQFRSYVESSIYIEGERRDETILEETEGRRPNPKSSRKVAVIL
jgi:hypothetical protein